ncbi:hypothetical protein [Actinacidiphila acididurans]|uniref:Secreted protein n=1 Tax=Actinacidiphila acididurans TaxID=2784346 RepID=A0ABS2TMV7_9ACTN|nr:hypothetical protein [Actinacidiphila acididurans]MBM9504402.1 hypothetical protein [Actinacidiphila acididurans]
MLFTQRSTVRRRGLTAVGFAAVLALGPAACGSSDGSGSDHSMPGMAHGTTRTASASASASPSADSGSGSDPAMGGMPGMDHMTAGNGLADAEDGYRFTGPDAAVGAARPIRYRFAISGPDGKPVTGFALDQTVRMHFYVVRSDLTGFQHVHPTMAEDGTWTADLAALSPGSWRLFASFIPDSGAGKGTDFVLSRTVTVPGAAARTPLPAAARTTEVDGYTVTVDGELMAGMTHLLTVHLTKNGTPVTDLQPYLDTYAHLTAFHEGDTAFAHLHPTTPAVGNHGGPDLSFHAELPASGNWRLFLQFRTAGHLHTAALTLHVA